MLSCFIDIATCRCHLFSRDADFTPLITPRRHAAAPLPLFDFRQLIDFYAS